MTQIDNINLIMNPKSNTKPNIQKKEVSISNSKENFRIKACYDFMFYILIISLIIFFVLFFYNSFFFM